ncbi:unnamed protein product, partial [Meganyctiphanes norvegica]
IIPYSYGYEVQDPLTNNYQNKAEIKTANGDVFGSYSVLMPDGYIYTTTYNSTLTTGFVSRLVKTLALLPHQLAAQTAATQQGRQQKATSPQQFQLVKSQAQLPQQPQAQLLRPQQPQQQQVQQLQTQRIQQLPQPQQLQPQQQLQAHQFQPQQLPQSQQLLLQQQHLQQQLAQQQQLQQQIAQPPFLQGQQPLQQGPFRVVA